MRKAWLIAALILGLFATALLYYSIQLTLMALALELRESAIFGMYILPIVFYGLTVWAYRKAKT